MTLQQALIWLNADKAEWTANHVGGTMSWHDLTAIATILNAVVKGELK